jgi:hypothetical protein
LVVRSTPKTLIGTDISNMGAPSNITTAMVARSRVIESSEHHFTRARLGPHHTTMPFAEALTARAEVATLETEDHAAMSLPGW